MNKFFYIALLVFLVFWPEASMAPESRMAAKLCDVRNVFCLENAGGYLVLFAILFLGILVFNNKVHWTLVVLITAGIVIFTDAEVITENISSEEFEVDAGCECND